MLTDCSLEDIQPRLVHGSRSEIDVFLLFSHINVFILYVMLEIQPCSEIKPGVLMFQKSFRNIS